MKLTFLGTGTSKGIPEIGCSCPTCMSTDPRDKRLRVSVLIETDDARILIDCGPDFRTQMLGIPFDRLDGVLLTHEHYDHFSPGDIRKVMKDDTKMIVPASMLDVVKEKVYKTTRFTFMQPTVSQ